MFSGFKDHYPLFRTKTTTSLTYLSFAMLAQPGPAQAPYPFPLPKFEKSRLWYGHAKGREEFDELPGLGGVFLGLFPSMCLSSLSSRRQPLFLGAIGFD